MNQAKLKNLFFLGGGNMAAAIFTALKREGAPYRIQVIEANPARREVLKRDSDLIVLDAAPVIEKEDILLIAVKPQDVKAALRGVTLKGPLILSIAAGLSLKTLERFVGSTRLARVMPNMGIMAGAGMTGVFASDLNSADRSEVETILRATGEFLWVKKEADLDLVTAISGSGPGYVFYFMDGLFKAAEKLGFKEKEAKQLVNQTFLGAVRSALDSPASFAELVSQVSSKKGTTAEAIAVFAQNGVQEAILEGVEACLERAAAIGSELEEE